MVGPLKTVVFLLFDDSVSSIWNIYSASPTSSGPKFQTGIVQFPFPPTKVSVPLSTQTPVVFVKSVQFKVSFSGSSSEILYSNLIDHPPLEGLTELFS